MLDLTQQERDVIKEALRTSIAINEGLLQHSQFHPADKVAKWKTKVTVAKSALSKL